MEKYVITMLGEKDHGKSTLIGNLLIHTGNTTEARIAEVKKTRKSSRFEPAHILDSFSEEREQEMTIDTTRASLVYKKAIFELIDVPGHLELIKNMMSGASNSDIAILMVSSKGDEGFKPQTKRHIFLSNMFGTKALVVAINKIDFAKYDKKVFEKIKGEVSDYLKSIGFDKPVAYVPISAYNNENLLTLSKNTPWYNGKPLFDVVSDFARKHSKSTAKKTAGFRVPVQDSMELDGEKVFFGTLNSGKINAKDAVRIEPEGFTAKIQKLYVKGKKVSSAPAGTNVAMVFDKDLKIDNGSIIYSKNEKPHKKGSFHAKLFVIKDMDSKDVKSLEIKINNYPISLKSMRLKEIYSPITGGSDKPTSTWVKANNVVYVDIDMKVQYPVERYKEHKELGRFAIYRKNEFVGVGIVE